MKKLKKSFTVFGMKKISPQDSRGYLGDLTAKKKSFQAPSL
jgi:hypothetical protein